jgi:hypothetical protein
VHASAVVEPGARIDAERVGRALAYVGAGRASARAPSSVRRRMSARDAWSAPARG